MAGSMVVFEFSVRVAAVLSIEETTDRVAEALNVRFREGKTYGVPSQVGDLLGMRLGLLESAGIGRKRTFRLDGNPMDARFISASIETSLTTMDISQGIADLLRAFDAGDWYVPSTDELAAEAEFETEMMALYDEFE